ncbi:MAG TPA: 2OG-Fe(II) oxygenase family protein [Caulobacteraceae bacterium]|nr:2OG-Fe(II) oxygenase family protein [Caulobacteraceae bacterium]
MAIQPVSFRLYEQGFDGFAEALGGSFERYGFAVVADHGLAPAMVAAALDDAKAFFALPEAAKRRYRIAGGAGQRGYTPFAVETAKGAEHADLKEFWHVGRAGNVWPDEIAGFQARIGGLYAAFDRLGQRLLEAIARHLGLPRGHFAAAVADGESILRLLHYPPTAGAGPALRAGAHEDINAITLLLGAEEAGLELLDRDGRWLAVNPAPGSLVVNIGDMLQRLTNHRLPSTTHRVVNPTPERSGAARYSMPFFLHFAPDYLIETLPGCIDAASPDRYPEPITARAYLAERLEEIRLA